MWTCLTPLKLTPSLILDDPNINSPAQGEPYQLYQKDRNAYQQRVRAQILEFKEADSKRSSA